MEVRGKETQEKKAEIQRNEEARREAPGRPMPERHDRPHCQHGGGRGGGAGAEANEHEQSQRSNTRRSIFALAI